jgi:hypothetical protein
MKKETAVEWLIDGLLMSGLLRITKEEHKIYKELKTRAIEMEKEQIEQTYDECRKDNFENYFITGKQYYNETYEN